MAGHLDTTFDLLRAWDFTTLYEKSYFILVHVALLLLGIYSIKNRIFDSKQRPRPCSPLGAPELPSDIGREKTSSRKELSLIDEQDLSWAKELATWLIKDSYVAEAINTWKSKMNARLLHNTTKEKVQIDGISKDQIKFDIKKIKTYKPDMAGQMNILVYFHIEKMNLTITFTNEDGECETSEMDMLSLSPLLHIQMITYNGRIRTGLKLSCLNMKSFQVELDNKEFNAELIRESFRRSMQDSFNLGATRGILKKEVKAETKIKEKSSQVDEKHIDEVMDSERHILVTDLDSAIAKVSSESPQKGLVESEETPLKLNISLPIKRVPEVKIQPATPLSEETNECSFFEVESPVSSSDNAVPGTQEYEEMDKDTTCISCVGNPGEPMELPEDAKSANIEVDVNENALSERENEDLQISDNASKNFDSFVENEVNHGDLASVGEDVQERPDEIVSEEVSETKRNENDMVIKEEGELEDDGNEEETIHKSESEIPDTNSESSKESVSLRKDEKKDRPKSFSEMALNNRGGMERSFDTSTQVLGKKSRTDVKRVNTFHLGSKSMVSIATTPKRSESMFLREAASQISLVSPVGYSPNKPSALIIEADEQGKKRYYHVPPAIARKGTYEQRGLKLHVYNGHIFIAQHFSKPLPECAVCSLPLARRIGKQGYQCRDCKAIAHKRCHILIGICEETSFPYLKIEYPWSTDV